jgi:hypothetical protein
MTLQNYLDQYKQPLSEQSMDAIVKLSEVAKEKKKKNKDKYKKAPIKNGKAKEKAKKKATPAMGKVVGGHAWLLPCSI